MKSHKITLPAEPPMRPVKKKYVNSFRLRLMALVSGIAEQAGVGLANASRRFWLSGDSQFHNIVVHIESIANVFLDVLNNIKAFSQVPFNCVIIFPVDC